MFRKTITTAFLLASSLSYGAVTIAPYLGSYYAEDKYERTQEGYEYRSTKIKRVFSNNFKSTVFEFRVFADMYNDGFDDNGQRDKCDPSELINGILSTAKGSKANVRINLSNNDYVNSCDELSKKINIDGKEIDVSKISINPRVGEYFATDKFNSEGYINTDIEEVVGNKKVDIAEFIVRDLSDGCDAGDILNTQLTTAQAQGKVMKINLGSKKDFKNCDDMVSNISIE